MAKNKIYSRTNLGRLAAATDPDDALVRYLYLGLQALRSVGSPDWSTLKVTIDRDGVSLDEHMLTITAQEA